MDQGSTEKGDVVEIITTRQQLVDLAQRLGMRDDWHEPDEQGVTARVDGLAFGNSGYWPLAEALRNGYSVRSVEQHVVLSVIHEDEACDDCGHAESEDVAAVNLATLLAWACGHEA